MINNNDGNHFIAIAVARVVAVSVAIVSSFFLLFGSLYSPCVLLLLFLFAIRLLSAASPREVFTALFGL